MHQGDQIKAQHEFRVALVQDWEIPAGARVLEIGCGQGDTTVALAEAVGPNGHVLAVDIAPPTYGSPLNLGEATGRISAGPLGGHIEFRFLFDPLQASFEANSFDAIVLAHCTWYFSDPTMLGRLLSHVRPWAPKLCLSEWDLQPRSLDQLGHLLAVVIQGQSEAFKEDSLANVRSPYSQEFLLAALAAAGWAVEHNHLLEATGLADAQWEIDLCLHDEHDAALPPKLRSLRRCLIDVLRRCERVPLASYSIVAT